MPWISRETTGHTSLCYLLRKIVVRRTIVTRYEAARGSRRTTVHTVGGTTRTSPMRRRQQDEGI